MKYNKYHLTCSIHLLPGRMSPPPSSSAVEEGKGNLHLLHFWTFLFLTMKERTISNPMANVHAYYDSGKSTMLYFYSSTEHNRVALSTNIEETRIILSKLSKVIYMTNQNTHGTRHVFINLQSGFSLNFPHKREDSKLSFQIHHITTTYFKIINNS